MIDIKYIIYSYIVGDSYGLSKLCNDKLDSISLNYNDILNIEKGYFSNMTTFMLATMDSISKNNLIVPIDILNKMCTSLILGKYTNDGKINAINKECINILNYYMNKNNLDYDYKVNDLSGYAISRILPIVIYDYYKGENNFDKLIQVVGITTSNDVVLLGSYILYKYIINLLNGMDKYKALKIEIPSIFKNKSIKYYKDILKGNIFFKTIEQDDNIVNIISLILYVILNSDNYIDVINMMNSLSGHTNIYSSFICLIASIVYGKNEILNKMIKDIKNKKDINKYIKDFEKVIKWENMVNY